MHTNPNTVQPQSQSQLQPGNPNPPRFSLDSFDFQHGQHENLSKPPPGRTGTARTRQKASGTRARKRLPNPKQSAMPFLPNKRVKAVYRKKKTPGTTRRFPEAESQEITSIVEEFYRWCEKRYSKFVALINFDRDIYTVVNGLTMTRYHPNGLEKIKRSIKERMGKHFNTQALMLTLQFDGNRFTVADSWRLMRSEISRLFDAVNIDYKRRGFKPLTHYVSAISPQPGSGRCHAHIAFPGLKFLDYRLVERLWGNGYVHVEVKDGINLTSYACRYISKFGADDLANSMLWYFKARLYSFSRSFYPRKEEKRKTGWYGYPLSERVLLYLYEKRREGHTIRGLDKFKEWMEENLSGIGQKAFA